MTEVKVYKYQCRQCGCIGIQKGHYGIMVIDNEGVEKPCECGHHWRYLSEEGYDEV